MRQLPEFRPMPQPTNMKPKPRPSSAPMTSMPSMDTLEKALEASRAREAALKRYLQQGTFDPAHRARVENALRIQRTVVSEREAVLRKRKAH